MLVVSVSLAIPSGDFFSSNAVKHSLIGVLMSLTLNRRHTASKFGQISGLSVIANFQRGDSISHICDNSCFFAFTTNAIDDALKRGNRAVHRGGIRLMTGNPVSDFLQRIIRAISPVNDFSNLFRCDRTSRL